MGKFDGYLFCTDCDGTLTDDNRRVSKENAQAIRYFQSEGGIFTVATGRNPDYIDNLDMGFRPNAPIIAVNGALLYDLEKKQNVCYDAMKHNPRELIEYAFSLETVEYISVAGDCGNIGSYINKALSPCVPPIGDELPVSSSQEILDHLKSLNAEILRIFFVQSEEATMRVFESINERFSDRYSVMMGWCEGVECLGAGCGKGQMIPRLKDFLRDEINTVVAAGDYHNDISLFKAADISYAVENAPDFVKVHASRTAPCNNKSAIAHIISQL